MSSDGVFWVGYSHHFFRGDYDEALDATGLPWMAVHFLVIISALDWVIIIPV